MADGEIDLMVGDTGLAAEAGGVVDHLEVTGDRLGNLPFVSIHSATARQGDIEAALEGVFRLHDERFPLSPPVDWWDEPYRRPGEHGFLQNSFVFADPLLADPRFAQVLVPLATILADWLTANPRSGATNPHRYAWHDHAAAGRIVVLAFTLGEGVRAGLLDRDLSETLATGVLDHARYLLAAENYAAQNNHGFASDAALTLAARSLAPVPQAAQWAEIAERRFAAILDHMIDGKEAVHLEHSPYYHWIISGALSRFANAGLFEGLDLAGLTHRMEESGAWLVAPDGTLPPIGDTPMGQRPTATATALSRSRTGMRVFRAAGYAAVRSGESALFVTAAHHPTAHKHADDGSFCLYENGRPIVLDSGNPGYEYESAEFAYGTSPAAHATICVDRFNWAKESAAYGSGMVAGAEREGLYALLTRNPGAVRGGGAARRALIYMPGHFLLIFDEVEAGGDHELVRTVPLAPDLEAVLDKPGEAMILSKGTAIARLVQLPAANVTMDHMETACGLRESELRGFRFPSPETPRPSYDVTLSGPGGHPRGLALLINGLKAPAVTWNAYDEFLEIDIAGLTRSSLSIRIGESTIDFRSHI